MTTPENYIQPDWPAVSSIRAYTTTRHLGFSQPPYSTFNLGDHVGDSPEAVTQNRQKLITDLDLPNHPIWMNQVHGNTIICLDNLAQTLPPTADAAYTTQANRICAVLTADCLPILLADRHGQAVAAIHAGWRGLQSGVIDQTIKHMEMEPTALLAWLGPAIGSQVFEIGGEVRDSYLSRSLIYEPAFTPHGDRWLADLYQLAQINLQQLGVLAIYGGHFCTYQDTTRFFSYRRDKGQTGRMATLIWIASE